MRCSLEKLFIMVIPTSAKIHRWKEICHEGSSSAEKGIFTHCIFANPIPWKLLTRFENSCASWLIAYHHGLQWEDRMIPYTIAKRHYNDRSWYKKGWRHQWGFRVTLRDFKIMNCWRICSKTKQETTRSSRHRMPITKIYNFWII